MPMYEVEMTGVSREVYWVKAKNIEEAKQKALEGKVPRPFITEIDSTEVSNIRLLIVREQKSHE